MAIDPRGKDFLDGQSVFESGTTKREYVARVVAGIRDKLEWLEMALDSDHTAGISERFEGIRQWAEQGFDEVADAPDVGRP